MPEVILRGSTYALCGGGVSCFSKATEGPDGLGEEGEAGAALVAGQVPAAKRLLGVGQVDGVSEYLPRCNTCKILLPGCNQETIRKGWRGRWQRKLFTRVAGGDER
eukprot:5578304-Pyramimonas_sp.AAC.1